MKKYGFSGMSALALAVVLSGVMMMGCMCPGQRGGAMKSCPMMKGQCAVPRGAFVESLANWKKYYSGPVWEKVFKALETVPADAPDGKTEIQGQDITMGVSSYDTKPVATAMESHQKYIDIQMVLVGNETFLWAPLAALTVKTPYNPANDCVMYDPYPPLAEFNARPGFFAVFMPQDAHATGIYAPRNPRAATRPQGGHQGQRQRPSGLDEIVRSHRPINSWVSRL